jgi:hypothetical protein
VLQDVESSDGDARFEIDGKVNHGAKLWKRKRMSSPGLPEFSPSKRNKTGKLY